ncbi:MAG: hypothetical protein IJS75_05560 [Bacteroidales bacterium]|nr:hypothetical protein [Bacteroidales bacterium]MBQ8461942.1 hypothetical protein [Bacteroidales bacterium]
MKKLIILLMALTVLSIAEPVYAQTNRPRNEFSISYGPLSRSKIYTIVKNILGKELTKNYGSNNFGARSFEYFYRISDFISVGAVFCAYHAKEWYDTVFGLNEEDDDKAKDKQNDYTVLGAIRFHWYDREWFGAYTKFAIGSTYHDWWPKDRQEMNFQVSLLGLEVGPPKYRVFAEFGAGEQGLILYGLRFRF